MTETNNKRCRYIFNCWYGLLAYMVTTYYQPGKINIAICRNTSHHMIMGLYSGYIGEDIIVGRHTCILVENVSIFTEDIINNA